MYFFAAVAATRECRRGDDDVVGLPRRRRGQRALRGVLDERHVDSRPKALLPDPAGRLARRSPAVEELGGGGGLGEHDGDRLLRVANRNAAAASPPSRSSAEAGRPVRRSEGRPAARGRRGGAVAPAPPRADPASRRRSLVAEVERSVNRARVGLVEVGGAVVAK